VLLRPAAGLLAEECGAFGLRLGQFEMVAEFALATEPERRSARRLDVIGTVVGDHRRRLRHGAQERRVGAADRVPVDVGPGLRVEGVEKLLVPDRSRQADLRVPGSCLGDRAGVIAGVAGETDHHERQLRRAGQIAPDDVEDVVLRLEPRDHEVVAIWGQAVVAHHPGGLRRGHLGRTGAVGDVVGVHPVVAGQLVTDGPRVDHDGSGDRTAPAGGETVVERAEARPLGALGVVAVDVQRGGHPTDPQHRYVRGVGGVEHQGYVWPVP